MAPILFSVTTLPSPTPSPARSIAEVWSKQYTPYTHRYIDIYICCTVYTFTTSGQVRNWIKQTYSCYYSSFKGIVSRTIGHISTDLSIMDCNEEFFVHIFHSSKSMSVNRKKVQFQLLLWLRRSSQSTFV